MPVSRAAQQDRIGSQSMNQAVREGELAEGANAKAVAYLERALKIAGFDPGTKDRTFSKDTAKALAQFQTAWGLPATGKLDEATLDKLTHTVDRARKSGSVSADKKGWQGTIGVGQKNADVFEAEKRLKKLGYDVGKSDGVFDRDLQAAVKSFKADQKSLSKDRSGMLGEKAMHAAGVEVRDLAHAPYRGRKTKDLKAHKRLNALTAKEAQVEKDGKIGIGEGHGSKRAIANVQGHLAAAGFDPGQNRGVWDERTQNALETFQKKAGLNVSGRVGPGTWAKLKKSIFTAKDGTSPAQRKGEKSAAVLRTEKLLRKAGYKSVKADGIFDAATQRASRKFEQKYRGLGDDGAVNENQLRRLKQVAHAKQDPGSGPGLKKGYRGAPVKTLQRRLTRYGFSTGGTDGIFGNDTRSAVKRFQKAFGLKADGIVGKQTWRMLGVDAKGKVIKPGAASGGRVSAGGGWGGSEGVANAAKGIAASMGIPVTSQKRDLATTIRVGSSTGSDHFTGNTTAFAVDFGVSGSRGDQLARAIASKYGIPQSYIGTFNRHTVNIGGQAYSLQLLWRVDGHFDHVHFGIRRA